jgi:hypothetical protein
MGLSEATKLIVNSSARQRARIAGVLYLLIFIVAPSGATTATAFNLIVTLVCDVAIAVLFYGLFRHTSRKLSLLASLFRLVYVVVMAVNSLIYFGIFDWTQNARSPESFDLGYGIALVPFGVHCLLTGILIFRSTFLPKLLGILMVTSGLAYLLFVWPQLGQHLFFPYIVVPAVLGEGSMTLWLLVMGVNAERWNRQASRPTQSAAYGKE